MAKLPQTLTRIFIPLTALALAACGGGGGGGSTPATPAATPPTASPDSLQVEKNLPENGTLLASDLDGDPLSYQIVTNGTLGTATITNASTGAFTYTPDPGVTGIDSFSFKANDGSVDSNTATVTVSIENTPPQAQDDNLAVNEEQTSPSNNLSATDSNGDAIASYAIATMPSKGVVNLLDAANGTYTYTASTGQSGTDTFTFTASDGTDSSSPATVTIEINAKPVVNGQCGSVAQNDVVGLEGIFDATDSGPLTFTLLNTDGSEAGSSLTTANGATVTLTDVTTGTYVYMAGTVRGRDTFTYRVTDSEGASSEATETVIVNLAIMPLGDSITQGSECVGGVGGDNRCVTNGFNTAETRIAYRRTLESNLMNQQFPFDFTGSLKNGSAATPPIMDLDHEGHGGWTALEIANGQTATVGDDGIFAWLEQNPSDFILLHAGTNGINTTTSADIAAILDEIDNWEGSSNGNHVTVLVAQIIDWGGSNASGNEAEVTRLNNEIADLVTNQRPDDDLVLVDMQNGAGINYVIGNDMSDELHPNQSGYDKIANTWLNALDPLLDKCP